MEDRIQHIVKRFCKKLFYMVLRISLSVVLTLPFGLWAIDYAYAERGYQAYGGEYLLIMWVFLAAFKVTDLKKN